MVRRLHRHERGWERNHQHQAKDKVEGSLVVCFYSIHLPPLPCALCVPCTHAIAVACLTCRDRWTNTSFRGPLLLCSVLLIVGNFLYGLVSECMQSCLVRLCPHSLAWGAK